MREAPNLFDADPIPDAATAEVARLLRSGDLFRYTAPADAPVALLEAEFAALTGCRYALATASCSAAMFLALTALDLAPGARVLVPAFTFAAVPSAVLHAGGVPVLVECGDDLRLDMADFAAKLAGADAVLVSHMRGHTSDLDVILAAASAAGVPVIEDAAHSLGTRWNGRLIGTLGRVGCFSFQSYKLLNAGEGGILVTDDADLAARAIIMSGAYERNWAKHPAAAEDTALRAALERWQNRLPLYNTRLSNLPAALVRAQLPHLEGRVRDGRRNHDRVASRLAALPRVHVPQPLPPERRAPDSIQFGLHGATPDEAQALVAAAARRGLPLQVFGLGRDNARAFWNWGFLGDVPDLPRTRAMLMRTCDLRLPARLSVEDCDTVAALLAEALAEARDDARAVA